jgi:hypothetical protein
MKVLALRISPAKASAFRVFERVSGLKNNAAPFQRSDAQFCSTTYPTAVADIIDYCLGYSCYMYNKNMKQTYFAVRAEELRKGM